ncbi:MAG: hypothetical protein HYX82_06520 [Chloroflexi bacterium]|nr:hypothetical protein [Chloroflexota bacterium]
MDGLVSEEDYARLDAVYVDSKDTMSIVALKPRPPFRPILQVATTKEGSGVLLLNEPLG